MSGWAVSKHARDRSARIRAARSFSDNRRSQGRRGLLHRDVPLYDARISPLFGPLSHLPETQLFLGADDPAAGRTPLLRGAPWRRCQDRVPRRAEHDPLLAACDLRSGSEGGAAEEGAVYRRVRSYRAPRAGLGFRNRARAISALSPGWFGDQTSIAGSFCLRSERRTRSGVRATGRRVVS